MRKYLYLLFLGAFALAAAQTTPPWQPAPGHQTIPLWPNGAPGAPPNPVPKPSPEVTKMTPNLTGGRPVTILSNVSAPTLTVYAPPKGTETGAAVLIFPGGGYNILAIDLEGTEVADWLNSIGVTAILVKYRVPHSGPYPKDNAALEDAQRALGLVRSRSAQWGIDPHRIGVIGFSAGANLAVALSNRYDTRIYPQVDSADAVSCRPDFSLIIYPAYLTLPDQGFIPNPDVKVDANGPPAFLIQAENDPVHVENAIVYYLALHNAKIPAEMHIYAQGGHGFGLRPTDLPITHWPREAAVWLHTIGVLK